jgi:hypothetical protein
MQNRYQYVRQKAFQAAAPVAQADFAETLDVCLLAALENDEITTSRAIEMFERLKHFCDVMGKYFERIEK